MMPGNAIGIGRWNGKGDEELVEEEARDEGNYGGK